MSCTPPVHQVEMLQYSTFAAAESSHQSETALRSVVVLRYWAVPQQPSQVQQPVNMLVVVAPSGMSQQRVWENDEAE